MSEKINVNTLTSTTWNWIKCNYDTVEINQNLNSRNPEILKQPENFEIVSPLSEKLPAISSGIANKALPKENEDQKNFDYTKIEDHPFIKIINETCKNPQIIRIKGSNSEPLVLRLNENSSFASKQVIIAEENSCSSVVLVFEGNPDSAFIRTELYLKENANLHIVKVQLCGDKTLMLDDTAAVCLDNSRISFSQIELGASHVDSGVNFTLAGYKACADVKVSYLAKNRQYFDFNHNIVQTGKKTDCKMFVDGTLKDEAVKTYRGIIDLKKGCSGSTGNEMETVMVLSPKTVNKAVPIILCAEDDVSAEHGSTIGKLSKDMLFYMETRGITQAEAERLISRAKIKALSDLIPDEETKIKISDFLDKIV